MSNARQEHPDSSTTLTDEELRTLDAHWRAANYLAVGQIYLLSNPLLTEPLRPEHVKPRLLGHWGTSPGLNLVHTHLNRIIKERGQDALCVWGPGHGGPAVLANAWLEGSYSQTYPDVTRDAVGMERLFRQFSFPAEYRATSPRRPLAPSMRAVNSATPCPTPTAPPSTIRSSLSPV
ncbi:putative phosphoketolase [Streptomyces alboflavus]|uniref:Putative phosphoketolase n=1 Tax=Streptomyces alboflavus TaxID=67267 RepID=A0A1Z1WQC1_9ACTN|nr:putative phosphoketolase [Streptomyces alboflavus]